MIPRQGGEQTMAELGASKSSYTAIGWARLAGHPVSVTTVTTFTLAATEGD